VNNKNTDPKICFATNLKKYMEFRGIGRRQLSEDIKIKYSTICEWLKGTMLPRADKMEIVANYFNTTSSELLKDPNAEILVYKYPFVSKLPSGYTLEQAADEFFCGWGIIQNVKTIPNHYGLKLSHECNPMQPRYVAGDSVSFIVTNTVDKYDHDYLIRRNGHDAEIVRIYEDQNPDTTIDDFDLDEEDYEYWKNEIKYYIMVPVYNEERNYEPFNVMSWDGDIEIIGKAD